MEVRPQKEKLGAGWEQVVRGKRVGSGWWVNRDGSSLDGKWKAWQALSRAPPAAPEATDPKNTVLLQEPVQQLCRNTGGVQ